ncbi:WD repeat-containing protein 24 [Clydaea vesicula]|uniref:WD repeat-containing protein 24 n=1 Tax=Clydaea vesicula TaxID=447962 RepID=A0AAD5U5K3_9FUNG|nr:WD repeat-containing protein 24 [Clydaea vesicula]
METRKMIKNKLLLNVGLSALSSSPDKDYVAVAGREIEESDVIELINLRAGLNVNTNFSFADVKWAGNYAKNVIASAANNGSVIIWDLEKSSQQKLDRVLTEHTRTVNKVCFHPTDPVLILSASQDGSMRLWDLRTKSIAKHTFEGKAESVRDIQFSPTGNFEFAAAFENGSIQKWDVRNPNTYEKKWNTHNGLALTVDFSFDGKYIASGGRDRVIKVLNTKGDNRKPIFTIQTIAPVTHVAWRPGYDSQLASSALSTDFRILVWDLSRPFVPSISLDVHDAVCSGFEWVDSDNIWSCSKDQTFAIADVRNGAKPIKHLNGNALSWNCFGDLTFISDEDKLRGEYLYNGDSYRLSSTTSSIFSRRYNRKSNVGLAEKQFEEKQDLSKLIIYQPKQKNGTLESNTFNYEAFVGLACSYSINSEDVKKTCLYNAKVALEFDQYQASQTWKILSLLFEQGFADDNQKSPTTIKNLTEIFKRVSSNLALNEEFSDLNKALLDSEEIEKKKLLLKKQQLQENLIFEKEKIKYLSRKKNNKKNQDIRGYNNIADFEKQKLVTTYNQSSTPSSKSSKKRQSRQFKLDSRLKRLVISHQPRLNTQRSSIGETQAQTEVNFENKKYVNKLKLNDFSSDSEYSEPSSASDNDSDGSIKVQSTSESDDDIMGVYGRNILARFVTSGVGGGGALDNNPVERSRKVMDKTFTGKVKESRIRKNSIQSSKSFEKGLSDIVNEGEITNDTTIAINTSLENTLAVGEGFEDAMKDIPQQISLRNSPKNFGNSITPLSTSYCSNEISEDNKFSFNENYILNEEKLIINLEEVDFKLKFWEKSKLVNEILEFYSEQGDVQICVTIIQVLQKVFKFSNLNLNFENFYFTYLELLSRYKIYTVSNWIILNSTMTSIRSLNQESSVVHTMCCRCNSNIKKQSYSNSNITSTGIGSGSGNSNNYVNLSNSGNDNLDNLLPKSKSNQTRISEAPVSGGNFGWYCEKCLKLIAVCSFCHTTCKGLYLWCQGCAHGGHLKCVGSWFKEESTLLTNRMDKIHN